MNYEITVYKILQGLKFYRMTVPLWKVKIEKLSLITHPKNPSIALDVLIKTKETLFYTQILSF